MTLKNRKSKLLGPEDFLKPPGQSTSKSSAQEGLNLMDREYSPKGSAQDNDFVPSYPSVEESNHRGTGQPKTISQVLPERLKFPLSVPKDEENDYSLPRGRLRFYDGLFQHYVTLFEGLCKIFACFVLVTAMFIELPKSPKEICEWIYIPLSFFPYLLLLSEYLPQHKKVWGLNPFGDRIPLIARYSRKYVGFSGEKVTFVYHFLFLLVVLMDGLYLENNIILFTSVGILVYTLILFIINTCLKLNDYAYIEVTTNVVDEIELNQPESLEDNTNEETKPSDEESENEMAWKKKRKTIYIVCDVFALISNFAFIILNIVYLVNNPQKSKRVVLFIISCGLALIFNCFISLNIYFESKENPKMRTLGRIVTGVLNVCFILSSARIYPYSGIPGGVIFVLTVSLGFVALYNHRRMKKQKKPQNYHKILKGTDYSIYFLNLSLAVLLSCTCVQNILEGNYFEKDVIKHIVYWCSDVVSKTDKKKIYDFILTDNVKMIKLLIQGGSVANCILMYVIWYYLMIDRKMLLHLHALYLPPAAAFISSFVTNSYLIVLEHLASSNWEWTGVTESQITLVDVENHLHENDSLFLGAVLIISILTQFHYHVLNEEGNLREDEDLRAIESVSKPKKNANCCEKIMSILVSTIFIILYVCIFIFLIKNDKTKITITSKVYGEKTLVDNIKGSKCSGNLPDQIIRICNDVDQEIETIASYVDQTPEINLLENTNLKYHFAAPSLLIIIFLGVFQLVSVCNVRARSVRFMMTALCLFASIPCIFFSAFLFLVIVFFTYVLIYPLYTVECTDEFMYLVLVSATTFLPICISLLEEKVIYFPVEEER